MKDCSYSKTNGTSKGRGSGERASSNLLLGGRVPPVLGEWGGSRMMPFPGEWPRRDEAVLLRAKGPVGPLESVEKLEAEPIGRRGGWWLRRRQRWS